MSINRDIPVPIYYQLKQILLRDIREGRYQVGDAIPTEQELIALYRVSRMTVRQAVAELATEGYLIRRKGKGTFVTQRRARVNSVLDMGQVDRTGDAPFRRKTLRFAQEAAPADVAALLELPAGHPVYLLERLTCFQDGTIRNFSRSVIPAHLFPAMEHHLAEVDGGLHRYFDSHGHPVTRIHQEIQASRADRDTAKVLGLQAGALILLVNNLARDGAGVPVDYTVDAFAGSAITISGTREPTG